MHPSEWLQAAFFYSGIIALMLGVYSLVIAPKAAMNRIFLGVCLAIGLWAAGFFMAVNAPDMASALFWRRFSALGWGSMYAILLHFCIAFAGGERVRGRGHAWIHPALYVPAGLMVWVFGLSDAIAPGQYRLERTGLGWTNVSVNNLWDQVFNVYYAGCMILGILLVWRRGRTSGSPKVRKQARLIVVSFFCAFLVGTATDILGNMLLEEPIPQIAPVILLMPIAAIYAAIVQYGLMTGKAADDAGAILTKASQAKVYRVLARALLVGGPLGYAVQALHSGSLVQPLAASLTIIALGLSIRMLPLLALRDEIKDTMLIAVIFAAIPIIVLMFASYGGVTIWAVSFLFIIVAMLFNRRTVLLSIAISVLSIEVLLWILRPSVSLRIDRVDYGGRILILVISLVVAFFVNSYYIRRLREHAEQLRLQRFLAEVSADFVSVDETNLQEKMNWVLRLVGKLFRLDQIGILAVRPDEGRAAWTPVWHAGNGVEADMHLDIGAGEDILWLVRELASRESVFIPDVGRQAGLDREVGRLLRERRIASMLAIPIAERPSEMKVLMFFTADPKKKWQDEENRTLHILAHLFNDGMIKVEAEREIRFMAFHDHLTGLPNRRLLWDRAGQALALSARSEKLVAFLFLDIDAFKSINDSVGHELGDQLIRVVAERLTASVRQTDTVSRFGGDEFLVMLNQIDLDTDIRKIVEKVIQAMKPPILLGASEYQLTTSVGVSVYPYDGAEIDSLVMHADIALHQAKENGRNQYVICSSTLKEETMRTIRIANSLHKALERREFHLVYQPQLDLASGEITGLEALIRWRHPELGMVPPNLFIPIAEKIGVIHEIGEWVLETAVAQCLAWQEQGGRPVVMAVNVSAGQLRTRVFLDRLHECLRQSGMDPRRLEIEITESAAVNETKDVVAFLEEIRGLGVMVAIDDFGTEYSSLSRLKELPIDRIKIDKQFVDGIGTSEKDQAIVRTIVQLARNLEVRVIAEGVEEENQRAFLLAAGCDEMQGYLAYRPMPPEAILPLLAGAGSERMQRTGQAERMSVDS